MPIRHRSMTSPLRIVPGTRATILVEASGSPAVFNEGLMELGSQVCSKHTPDCSACPVRRWCEARKQDRVDVISCCTQAT